MMNSNKVFIDRKTVKEALGLKGRSGDVIASVAMSFLGLNKINRSFRSISGLSGFDFVTEALKELDVTPLVSEEDLAQIPATGPFIMCSNHPFGCVDGFILMSIVGKIRPDVMFMTNYMVSQIPCIKDIQIAVNPFEGGRSSVNGVKRALEHIRAGKPLVIFPAGEVSSNRNPQHIVKDIDWAAGSMKLVQKAEVPIIPAFVEGQNSKLFHALGAIHPRLRTVRLPWELLNKQGQEFHIRFGRAVPPAEAASYATAQELGAYLRNRTYALEADLHQTSEVIPRKSPEAIQAHIDPSILHKELEGLSSNILHSEGGYTCYLNRYAEIPNIIKEIGVCREETFRLNGEGTGKSIDLDEYDLYYLHLHLWDDASGELVGAYRVGLGSQIMKDKGIRGFYSDLFFHFKDTFGPSLEKSIELGRSFIVPKYQVVPNALKMLLNNGVARLGKIYPEVRYFIGPASISSDIPREFSSLIVEYFKRTNQNKEFCDMVVPEIPFVPYYGRMDVDAMKLDHVPLNKFDKLISRLSNGKYRVPTLLRAYVKFNCSFIGFNVDPDFNYCIDAFIIVEFEPGSDLTFTM